VFSDRTTTSLQT